jgi:two-component system sensor histidine kinase DegS
VFRLVQESLQNVVKHSGVTSAEISMTAADGALRLVVKDAGRGFDAAANPIRGGLGLVSMRERVHLVGGSMTIRTKLGSGTRLDFEVPLLEDERVTPPEERI